jgi:thioredoxin-related protein
MEGLRLVELGQQRPLKLHERLLLIYNSPLCLHCNCKRDKFNKERAKMRAIEWEG